MKPIPIFLTLAVVAASSYAVLLASPLGRQAKVATGYSARVTCACRYIAGRTLESCKTDLEPGTEIAALTDSPQSRSITATVPLLARSTATYTAPTGCTLVP